MMFRTDTSALRIGKAFNVQNYAQAICVNRMPSAVRIDEIGRTKSVFFILNLPWNVKTAAC